MILSDGQTEYPLARHLEVLEDPSGNLTIDQVASPSYTAKFTPLSEQNANYAYTQSAIWVRIQIQNQARRENWLLEIEDARLGWVDFYRPAEDGAGFEHISTGAYRPFSTREFPYLRYLFRLPVSLGDEETVYLRLQTDTVMLFPMRVLSWTAFHAQSFSLYLGFGLFYGAIALLAVYNLYLFFSLRDQRYLFLILFILFSLLNLARLDGVGQQFIWPGLANRFTPLAAGLLGNIFGLVFVMTSLQIKTHLPGAQRVFLLLITLSGVAILMIPFSFYTSRFISPLTSLSALVAVLAAIQMWRRGFRAGRFYQPAWACLLLILFTANFYDFGIIHNKAVLYVVTYTGIFLLALFLSMALSDRMHILKQEAEQAGNAVREGQARLSGILDNAAEAIISIDETQRILLYNQGAELIFGYPAHEALGQPIDLIIPKRFGAVHKQHIDAFGRSEEARQAMWQRGEVYGLRKDGEEFPAEASISKLRLNGHLIYSAFLRDISDRKQREEALRESETRFQQLYNRSPVGIFIADLNGRFIHANTAFQAFTGYQEAELFWIAYWELIHPEDREASMALFDELTQEKRSFYEKESRYLRKDGSTIWGAKIVSVLRNADGKASSIFGLVKDINGRKQTEADLELYRQHLEELVASRTAELEKSRSRLAILNQASRVVNSASLDPDQIYVAIHQVAAWMMPVDVFSIALVDDARGEIEDLYRAGPDGRLPGRRRPLKSSCAGWILEHGCSLWVEDFSLAEPEADIFGLEEGMRSGLSVLLQSGQRLLGALCLKSGLPHAYSPDDQKALESFAAHAAIAIENTRLYQQAQETAVSEERQRLARELHDSVTQLLYSMSLLSSGWKKMAQDSRLADPAASFQQLEGIGLQALKEMRLLIHQLRPSVLEEAGLAGALQHRLEAVEQRANIDSELLIDGDLPPLSPLVEEQLYNIAQEALNNALRHAQASAISVHIRCQSGQLGLSVWDNGVGFNPDYSSKGIGMRSMHERAEAIAAQLSVSSQPQEGSMVQVIVAV